LDWKTSPEQFRTAHEKTLQAKQAIEAEYTAFKATSVMQQSDVQRKLADLEKKRFWTPEDEAKYASLERRGKDIEAELYARDFEASPQYKAEFTEKWNEAYTDAVNAVVSMEVTVRGDDGEEKTRSATKRDFESIRALAGDPSAQRKLAKQLFGEDADIVLGHTRALVGIEKDAAKAVTKKRTEYESNLKTYLENSQNVSRAQRQASEAAEQDLIKTHPQFFGDNPNDPKENEALKRGLEFVDNSYSREATAKMNPMQLAERATVLRYMAGAFPRLCATIKRLQADNTSKDDELKKYRGADPGALGDSPASSPTDKKNEGTKSLEEQLAALDE
jgi:tryptophan 2,3-dioxygenase